MTLNLNLNFKIINSSEFLGHVNNVNHVYIHRLEDPSFSFFALVKLQFVQVKLGLISDLPCHKDLSFLVT